MQERNREGVDREKRWKDDDAYFSMSFCKQDVDAIYSSLTTGGYLHLVRELNEVRMDSKADFDVYYDRFISLLRRVRAVEACWAHNPKFGL